MARGCWPHAQPLSWRTTPWLSAAAYSMYSQITSITGGRPSIRDPRTRHAVVTGTHLTWGTWECEPNFTVLSRVSTNLADIHLWPMY
jgi:hypothetical protein